MKKKEFTLLVAILLIGAFLRFWWIKDFPLGLYPDEAMNGSNALEALSSGHFQWFYPENNGREGLFINIQAFSVWLFGNIPWALRIVSGVFGTLTILGIYLLTKELFHENEELGIRNPAKSILNSSIVALLSSFFLATSYWHVNFSRIGFRAITVPFFATFALFFLLKGLRRGKILDLIFGGIFMGLGFHTYIAFRFMPLVIVPPILWYLWQWKKDKSKKTASCVPCAASIFLFATFVVALPIGLYFLKNPQNFVGRSTQVSIFTGDSPVWEFVKSNVLTLGMYFVHGDCNWRHNYRCKPELHPLVAIGFVIGILSALTHVIRALRKKPKKNELEQLRMISFFLLFWFAVMTLPATLTREGLPHALRAIGTIPPVMILAAFGVFSFYNFLIAWFEKKKLEFTDISRQIKRIQRELGFIFAIIFFIIPPTTYYTYFFLWASRPENHDAFAVDLANMGYYLNSLPHETKKYVVVNLGGVDVRGIPMPAQTVMFLTDTFGDARSEAHNFVYLIPEQISQDNYKLDIHKNEKVTVAFLDGKDKKLVETVQKQNPQLKIWVPEDFVTLRNFE